jgi:ATP-dependent Lon protease
MAINIITNSPQIPQEAGFAIRNIESPSFLINFISSNMNLDVVEKQKLLETANIKDTQGTGNDGAEKPDSEQGENRY